MSANSPESARRLGELYERLAVLRQFTQAMDPADAGLVRGEIAKLSQQYGAMNVAWMINVMKEDEEASR